MGVYLLLLNYNSTTLKTKVKNYFSEVKPTIKIEITPYKIIPIVMYTPIPTMCFAPFKFLNTNVPYSNIDCKY